MVTPDLRYDAVPENAEKAVADGLEILLASAERELGAFLKAVTDSFGSEMGPLAAQEWLEMLDSEEALPCEGARDWRSITIGAASRLATRLNAVAVQ